MQAEKKPGSGLKKKIRNANWGLPDQQQPQKPVPQLQDKPAQHQNSSNTQEPSSNIKSSPKANFDLKKKVKNKNWDVLHNDQPQAKQPQLQSFNLLQKLPPPAPILSPKYLNISKLSQKYAFSIESVLGSGFASTVYLGSRNQTQELVCIKAIDLLAMGLGSPYISFIHKEIEALRRFSSEHIVKLYDVYQSNTFYYLVMELCPGGDLFKLMRISPGDLPQQFVDSVMWQVVSGLAVMHGHNVVHRDLKTENVFVSSFPTHENDKIKVKLGDLGFCASLEELQSIKKQGRSPQNVGSPIYMSPQTCLTQNYSLKSDIYSIGIIWYELYHKRAPWQAKTEVQLLDKKLNQPVTAWREDISASTRELIAKCISNDVEVRPTCEQILSILAP